MKTRRRRSRGGGRFQENLAGVGDCLHLQNGQLGGELPLSLGWGVSKETGRWELFWRAVGRARNELGCTVNGSYNGHARGRVQQPCIHSLVLQKTTRQTYLTRERLYRTKRPNGYVATCSPVRVS